MTENDLLSELQKEYAKEERLPGDVDAAMMASATGLSKRHCLNILEKKAEIGELKRVKVRNERTGMTMLVFRKP